MIILDPGEAGAGTKDGKYVGLTLRHPSAAFTRTNSLLLPDYNTSEALYWNDTSQKVPPKRPRVNPQILKAAAYAFAAYLFLSLVIVLPLAILKTKKQQSNSRYKSKDSLWDDIEDANPPSMLQLSSSGAPVIDFNKTCNIWSHHTDSSAQASFYLPPNGLVALRSNATFNPAQSPSIFGNLLVEMNPDPSEKNIFLNLGLTYSRYNLFTQTNICFSREGSNRGLSIYVPSQLIAGDRLGLNISVLLPQVKATVNNFITYLPMLSQTFGALGNYTTFDQMTLEGAGQPIKSKFLQAHIISIKNLAAPIEGAYNVTGSLVLDTVKGPVTSNVTLTQLPYPMQPTLLQIDTGDSAINANVVLDSSMLSPRTAPKAPAFGMQVNNFNGPLNMSVAYSQNTPNTTMQLTAQNNLAPTSITVDARYQGNFCAKSKLDPITVGTFVSPSDDPTGARRSWILNYDLQKADIVTGWAGWSTRPMQSSKQGNTIDITATLSPVTLNFGSQ